MPGPARRAHFPPAWLRGRKLRSRLVLIVLATLLPLALFAIVLILLFAHDARRTTERGWRMWRTNSTIR
jgi:hypothetical protein